MTFTHETLDFAGGLLILQGSVGYVMFVNWQTLAKASTVTHAWMRDKQGSAGYYPLI